MKKSLVLVALLSVTSLFAAPQPIVVASAEPMPEQPQVQEIPQSTSPAATSTVNVSYPACPKHEQVQVKEQTFSKPSAPQEQVLEADKKILISVVGQGVAPMNTSSPAQAYALAKRAAVADAYRLIAEKVKGVRVDGQDLIKNMMVKRSTVRTSVQAMVRNANIVETTFKEGLCEVEMEIEISHAQFQ